MRRNFFFPNCLITIPFFLEWIRKGKVKIWPLFGSAKNVRKVEYFICQTLQFDLADSAILLGYCARHNWPNFPQWCGSRHVTCIETDPGHISVVKYKQDQGSIAGPLLVSRSSSIRYLVSLELKKKYFIQQILSNLRVKSDWGWWEISENF